MYKTSKCWHSPTQSAYFGDKFSILLFMKSHSTPRKHLQGKVLSLFMSPVGVALGGTALLALALTVSILMG